MPRSEDASRPKRRFRSLSDDSSETESFLGRHRVEQRRRHAEPGWFEWLLREFARYWYLIGALALLVFVPLQIQDSLMPAGSPSAVAPVLVGVAMVVSAVVVLAAAVAGYVYLWKPGGLIDRLVADHEG